MKDIDWRSSLADLAADLPPGHDPAPDPQPAPSATRSARIYYEAKGRRGKKVTILADFKGMSDEQIQTLAAELKRTLGTGGSYDAGEILLQGDRRKQAADLLRRKGIKV